MRLWSIHPKYLDQKQLTSCWREAIGIKTALEKKATGYNKNQQLNRFKSSRIPLAQINSYLYFLLQEALLRGYEFDSSTIDFGLTTISSQMSVTDGQVDFEFNKLKSNTRRIKKIEAHPLFYIIPGEIEFGKK